MLKEKWKGFWNDPVWSKVIAWAIIAVITGLLWDPFHWWPVICPSHPGTLYVLAAATLFAVLGLYFTRNKQAQPGGTLHVVFRLLCIAFTLATALFAFHCFRGNCATPLFPYPRADGLIADFTSGPGGPARTALGTQFSLLSDSAWNLSSKVWYERVDEGTGSTRNGFLRIYYQLEPAYSREPYVGIYADFSFPPPISYDVSRFRKLTLRLRGDAPVSGGITVAIVLYSANVTDPGYAFATWQIPTRELTEEWVTIDHALEEFGRPHFVNYNVNLDSRRVYRIAVVIFGQPNQQTQGHIDVDDLRFE